MLSYRSGKSAVVCKGVFFMDPQKEKFLRSANIQNPVL